MSSQQQQHVINMTGLDSGPVTTSIGGGSSTSTQGQQSAYTNSASHGGPSTGSMPSGAYRPGSTQRSPRPQQSSYAPLSPSQSHAQNYASPHMPALSPTSGASASTSQLARSQSLGHAAYQQMQASSHQGYGAYAQPPIEASPYRSRDKGQPSYSEGNSGHTLLPTINTHIPRGSLMGSPYSPNMRHSMALDTPTHYNVASGPPKSPVTRQQGGASPYSSNVNHSSRPVSMFDTSYGLHQPLQPSSRNSFHPVDNAMASNHRASPGGSQVRKMGSNQHLRGSDGTSGSTSTMAMHMAAATSPHADSLPLYSNPSAPTGTMPASSYGNASTGQYVGPPPRASIGGGGGLYGMSVDSSEHAGSSHRLSERRGTVTGAEADTAGEYTNWERQQRMAAAGMQYQQAPPPPKLKTQEAFRRVRDVSDLKAVNEPAIAGTGRRADPSGGYVSPLKAMTAYLHHTYHLVNPAFFYELSFNPRRVLTKPSKPMHNEGHDNEDSDYILYVNDWLGAEEGNRYLILDILGQGTFGQVVKCQNMKTREIVAVKVIKNKPAYFNQSMMEVTILEMLNGNWDPHDQHHILRLRDTFIHAKHLCLVFELLSSNLYELIKQNSFRGLSTSLVRVFTTQLLDALTVLHEARLIHCDLKPENILLKTLQTPSIKLVDFGSACHERQTVYTYIQSRFYRSPEVLLGLPYNASIDMWSLGCIAVELFLGLPLFPGTSEYNQVCRIVEMLGLPPSYMLESGKQTGEFFTVYMDEYNRRTYKLKGLEQYSKEHNVQEQPSKRYFQATTLPDIIKTYPLARKSGKAADVQKEMANRSSFVDFVTGLLHMDPTKRWTPQQAKLHPFITGEKLTQPFKPPMLSDDGLARPKTMMAAAASSSNSTDVAKHPYGGLPQTPSRSSGRVYHDAAAYNQHLAQQQVYNSAHQARQNQAPAINNPYAQEEMASRNERAQAEANALAKAKTQAQVQQAQAQAQAHAHAQAQAQVQAHAQAHAAQVQAAMSPPYGQGTSSATTSPYIQTRSRSNTMTRMDLVPGQLAKMGIEAGQSVTPVLNREESMREWERRYQNGGMQGGATMQSSTNRPGKQPRNDYQHLDLLQQQAEASPSSYSSPPAAQQWSQLPNAMSYSNVNRLTTSATSPSNSAVHSPPSFSVIVEAQQQQQQHHHLHHQQQQQQQHQHAMGGSHESLSAMSLQQSMGSPNRSSQQIPPSTYTSPSGGSNRYQPANAGNNPSLAAFDPYTSDIAQLMPALQPTQYQGGGGANVMRQSMMPSSASLASSLYGSPVGSTAPAAVSGPTSPRGREDGYQQQQSSIPGPYHSQVPSASQGGRMHYG